VKSNTRNNRLLRVLDFEAQLQIYFPTLPLFPTPSSYSPQIYQTAEAIALVNL
jgi:hypothetical protein